MTVAGTGTTPDRCYSLNQAPVNNTHSRGRAGGVPSGGKTNGSQTATDVVMVIEQSLGSWSHLWSLSNVNVCGSTSLFGSCAGTHHGKGSVSCFER